MAINDVDCKIVLSCSPSCSQLQATVLGQSPREISQTVCIHCHSFLSHVRISVWPSTFL